MRETFGELVDLLIDVEDTELERRLIGGLCSFYGIQARISGEPELVEELIRSRTRAAESQP